MIVIIPSTADKLIDIRHGLVGAGKMDRMHSDFGCCGDVVTEVVDEYRAIGFDIQPFESKFVNGRIWFC